MRPCNRILSPIGEVVLGIGTVIVVGLALNSCARPDHDDPEKDLPVIMGYDGDAPMGCLLWEERLESICCYLKETSPGEWTLPNGWDC